MGYPEMTISLSAGDMLFLFSDGTVEAMNGAGEMFGFERLTQAVAQGPTSSAEAMLLHLIEAIEHFVADAEPHDDITMIVIRKL
jgi:sigma-B regulation protein RsbU (phosphoserine phosphatase)